MVLPQIEHKTVWHRGKNMDDSIWIALLCLPDDLRNLLCQCSSMTATRHHLMPGSIRKTECNQLPQARQFVRNVLPRLGFDRLRDADSDADLSTRTNLMTLYGEAGRVRIRTIVHAPDAGTHSPFLHQTHLNCRGGSVCLNSFGRFAKWISASAMPLPSLVPAR